MPKMSNNQWYDYVLYSWLAGTRFSDLVFEVIKRFDFEPTKEKTHKGQHLYSLLNSQMTAFRPADRRNNDA